MHRCLTVSVPLLRVWVHCPRVPEQFVTSPLCLVGYVRWDARSDRVPPLQTIIFSSFTGRTRGCRPFGSTISLFPTSYPLSFPIFAHSFALFCTCKNRNSFLFVGLHTLREETGGGVPLQPRKWHSLEELRTRPKSRAPSHRPAPAL